MGLEYIILIIIIPLIGFGFYKALKHNNCELNFKESLIYSICILLLTSMFLIDYKLIKINTDVFMILIIYLLILLLIYYIIRTIKLKKYIPIKVIIGYTLISIASLIAYYIFLPSFTSNAYGLDIIILYLFYIVLAASFTSLLIVINIITLIIKLIIKTNLDYKNKHYKISKLALLNIITTLSIIGLIYGIDSLNKQNSINLLNNYKKLI